MRVQIEFREHSIDIEEDVKFYETKPELLGLVERSLIAIGYTKEELREWFTEDEL